jgi:hypothetical protein
MFGRRARPVLPDPTPEDRWRAEWSTVLAILFPEGLDDVQVERVRSAVGDGAPTVGAARRALGVLDQQTARSPVTIRWGEGDLAYVDVEGVRMALDTADASVSVQILDGKYEPHVTTTLDRLLDPGDVFVDVGANVGAVDPWCGC